MAAVVVTGSTKGIGRGLAAEFVQRGHHVVVSGRSQDGVDDTVVSLSGSAGEIMGKVCEVSDYEQVLDLWNAAESRFGPIDIWVNNAGLARTIWSIADTPASEISAMISTNMLGMVFGSQVAGKGMSAAGGGKIFNILGGGSDGEYFPGLGIYGTTKRGLDYFTDAFAREMDGTGVLVGKVRPGMVITDAVIREAQADLENFEKSRKMMNNLVDKVETVAPFLVDQMLAMDKTGRKIRWLTGGKIARRMLLAKFRPRPDLFTEFGL